MEEGDEEEILVAGEVVETFFEGLDPRVQDIVCYLLGLPLEEDERLKRNKRRFVERFMVCDGKLNQEALDGFRVVVPIDKRIIGVRALQENIGHWEKRSTAGMVTYRFWWSSIKQDVESHVKKYDSGQRIKAVSSDVTSLNRPVAGLFEVLSIDFAGPFPIPHPGWSRCLFVCTKPLTKWPTVRASPDVTADNVIRFMEEEVLHFCGSSRIAVSDNPTCFTARNLVSFSKNIGITWKPVTFYTHMSKVMPETMCSTSKMATGRFVKGIL